MKVAVILLSLILNCMVAISGPPAFWDDELVNIQAVAGTPAGAVATARDGGKKHTSIIRYRTPGETKNRILEIKGQVRSLAFVEDGNTLLAVVVKPFKKRPWDTYLLGIKTATAKTERLITMPGTTAGMALWPEKNHLLIACGQEIRTLILPEFRSGPLYQLPGGNLTLVHHSGSLVLVGQSGDLILINLEDTQNREQIPVRQRIDLPSPLLAMSLSSDGKLLYGVRLDGTKVKQPLDMLDLSAAALPLKTTPPEPVPIPAPVTAESTPVVTEDTPPELKPEPEPLSEPELQPEPQPEPARTVPAGEFQLYGFLQGEAASHVEWVVLMGPDNILREAARIHPQTDGSWGVESLLPGRYRIILNGGGGHVVESDPRFATVRVVEGESVAAPTFRVQKIR